MHLCHVKHSQEITSFIPLIDCLPLHQLWRGPLFFLSHDTEDRPPSQYDVWQLLRERRDLAGLRGRRRGERVVGLGEDVVGVVEGGAQGLGGHGRRHAAAVAAAGGNGSRALAGGQFSAFENINGERLDSLLL